MHLHAEDQHTTRGHRAKERPCAQAAKLQMMNPCATTCSQPDDQSGAAAFTDHESESESESEFTGLENSTCVQKTMYRYK